MSNIPINSDAPPFISYLMGRISHLIDTGNLTLPNFTSTEVVFSVSDYAGENQKSTYQALSFAIVDWSNAGLWESSRLAHQIGFRRDFEFKKLNQDRERRRLLPKFLNTTAMLNGIVVTYLIDNQICYLFSAKSPHTILAKLGLGEWKPHIAEKLLRAIHLQAPIVNALTTEQHKFLWLTDRDSITKDKETLDALVQSIFNLYATHGFREFGYAEPFDDGTRAINDLLSIPDLIAGSALEYCNAQRTAQEEKDRKLSIQPKTDEILSWYADTLSPLKKLMCVIDLVEGKYQVRFLNFKKYGVDSD